jgi:hypothetical protein
MAFTNGLPVEGVYMDALYISPFNRSTNFRPSLPTICRPFLTATLTVETEMFNRFPISIIDMPNSAKAQLHIKARGLTMVRFCMAW